VKKSDAIKNILGTKLHAAPRYTTAKAFAPTNIALCKYWGKRDQELNLPVTSSLSISLDDRGANTEISISHQANDLIFLNNHPIDLHSKFGTRLVEFLNLFRAHGEPHFIINIETNIPIAAGLASSACGFAALVKVLNHLFGWDLSEQQQSILARLGSGSASRSIWQGFVEWHAGVKPDGSDSFAEPLNETWPDLCIGILMMSKKEKKIGSREAMQRTVSTSPLYSAWPHKVTHDMSLLKTAITVKDFQLLGKTAESNATTMHATMLAAWPPITYLMPDTLIAMQKIWDLRQEGLPIYFTQDAGPNLKLLFLQQDMQTVSSHFPEIEIILPFA
jgi:diphosphomevalonate decarboxylase